MKKGVYRLYCKKYGYWSKTDYTGTRKELSYIGALLLHHGNAIMIKQDK